MSELADFVLTALQQAGAIIEPPAYGVQEVLLPEAVARRWAVSDYLRLTFEEADRLREVDRARVTFLGYGHPLVETLAEGLRGQPANAQSYINDVRLEKRGLLDLARKQFSFPNARVTELPHQSERPGLCHYLRFNFKAALITDEKREQLVSVWMDVQGGHPAHVNEDLATLADRPGFPHLPTEPLRWSPDGQPLPVAGDVLTRPVLSALLDRATHAALDELGESLTRLQARAAHFLELDRARLTQYYDDLERNLQRRTLREGAPPERRAALEDKLAATRAERQAKLADAEAKYHLRVELELVNLLLVAQPKVLLPVQVGNRSTQIQRTLVWDPLQHRLEPLVCDVCHQPGESLHLCVAGHLAHEDCLLPEQCVDCKRVYCRLCADQMSHCVVCDRPVCQRSLIRCKTCQRGTCQEHKELCHAADGQPARLPKAEPQPKPAPAPQPQPTPRREGEKKPAKRREAERPVSRYAVTGPEIQAYVEPEGAVLSAYVLTAEDETLAFRQWQLGFDGVAIFCQCEKMFRCPANGRLERPARPEAINEQLAALLDELREEYQVPARRVAIHALVHGEPRKLPQLSLHGAWRDEEAVGRARAGYEVSFAMQFPDHPRALPLPPFVNQVDRRFGGEVGSLLFAMRGLLVYEGVLDRDELLVRAAAVVRPGPWYNPKRGQALLATDPFFRPWRGKLVSLTSLEDPLAVWQRKREPDLPPRHFTLVELLDAADPDAPLSQALQSLERKLARLGDRVPPVRAIQARARSQPTVEALAETLAVQAQAPADRQDQWLDALGKLWQLTPRYELRGRTPAEVGRAGY